MDQSEMSVSSEPAPVTPPKFFIYGIESPSDADAYMDRSERTLLERAAQLDDIPCVFRTVISRAAFVMALTIGLTDAREKHNGHLPVLHISTHGNSEGIGLSDGTLITWSELRELLVPINGQLNGNLLLCMSSCKGYSACRMAMCEGDEPHPYIALFANAGTPKWSDTAVAYATVYHLLAKGRRFDEACHAMNLASGESTWVVETAHESKKVYTDYVQEEMQRQLQAGLSSTGTPALGEDLSPTA
jgi:hypothetical protein